MVFKFKDFLFCPNSTLFQSTYGFEFVSIELGLNLNILKLVLSEYPIPIWGWTTPLGNMLLPNSQNNKILGSKYFHKNVQYLKIQILKMSWSFLKYCKVVDPTLSPAFFMVRSVLEPWDETIDIYQVLEVNNDWWPVITSHFSVSSFICLYIYC